jgi:hypothetical protein
VKLNIPLLLYIGGLCLFVGLLAATDAGSMIIWLAWLSGALMQGALHMKDAR